MNLSALRDRKILGVPVLYLLAGAVVIFAVYAWRMKASEPPAPDAEAMDTSTAPDTEGTYLTPTLSTGTVIVAQPPAQSGNASITTNEEWIKAGVAHLATQGVSGGTALQTLQAYLNGAQLSYTQGQHRDSVIAKYGVPPFLNFTAGGTDPQEIPVSPTPPPATVPPNVELTPWPEGAKWVGDDTNYNSMGGGTTWTVDPGDTLAGIAAHYNMSWRELYDANRDTIQDPQRIYVGQVLRIP